MNTSKQGAVTGGGAYTACAGLLGAALLGAALLTGGLAAAGESPLTQIRPTLNFYGVTGLIDMPSGESQPDGQFTIAMAHFGSITRTTLSFQITPRLAGSFRYVGTANWNRVLPSGFSTFYDRSFDVRYQMLLERRWQPAVTIGLQDFAGTGLLSG